MIPGLKFTENIKKYEKYSVEKREAVVYDYLFNGSSHRWLDEHILGCDSSYTRGWDSMAILHHLGLINSHKGIFKECKLEVAIHNLEEQKDERLQPIINMLYHRLNTYNLQHTDNHAVGEHIEIYDFKTLEEVHRELEEEVKCSRHLNAQERQRKLENTDKKPKLLKVTTQVYRRNPDVVVAVLERANGVCERCGIDAPFKRVSDGTPYLEVHHKKRLADGGEDTVENAIAVCPNCHRELHYGI